MDTTRTTSIPLPIIFVAFAGSVAALIGGYWDDAWHTERGRDDFFIAPHLAIYGGVTATGGALALWTLAAIRRAGLRAALRDRVLLAALAGVMLTLSSAPIDNAWHEAFGRDAVIWSPPHLLGIVGMVGLGVAVLAGTAGRPLVQGLAGGFVLAAATFTVVEYETDVPQYDELWYLPVLAFAAVFALRIVQLLSSSAAPAVIAAGAHLAFVGVVAVLLAALGFDAPALPVLLAPAAALEVARRRGWSTVRSAAASALALCAASVPARLLLEPQVPLDAFDIAAGLPLAGLAAWLALTAVAPSRESRTALVAAATMLLALLAAPGALAHDPGQGDDAGAMRMRISVQDHRATVAGRLLESACAAPSSGELIGRRAGEVVRAPLRLTGCAFAGALDLPDDGRWFVYARVHAHGGPVEAWLPVDAGDGNQESSATRRFAYFPSDRDAGALQTVASVVLYAGVAAFLIALAGLARSVGSPSRFA